MMFHSIVVGSQFLTVPKCNCYLPQCFTILWQQPEIQALQVLNSKKQWINATPIPGTLVIKYVASYMEDIIA